MAAVPPPVQGQRHPSGSRVPAVVWVIVAVALLSLVRTGAAVVTAVAGAVGDTRRLVTLDVPAATVHPNCLAARSYPGQNRADDYCADRSGRVILRDVHLTVAALRAGPAGAVCAPVAYRSHHDKPLRVALADWRLRGPDGGAAPRRPGTLRPGVLAPGAALSGTVCFAAPPATGRAVLIADPTGWDRFRGVWIADLPVPATATPGSRRG